MGRLQVVVERNSFAVRIGREGTHRSVSGSAARNGCKAQL
jgi:hypothetical protein